MRAPSDWKPIGPLVSSVLAVLTAMPLIFTEIEPSLLTVASVVFHSKLSLSAFFWAA